MPLQCMSLLMYVTITIIALYHIKEFVIVRQYSINLMLGEDFVSRISSAIRAGKLAVNVISERMWSSRAKFLPVNSLIRGGGKLETEGRVESNLVDVTKLSGSFLICMTNQAQFTPC